MRNIFAGLNIQLSDINKFEENPTPAVSNHHNEATSIITDMHTVNLKSTNAKGLLENKSLTKKEKMLLKHKKLMEKLDATQKVKIELQKRKRKQKRTNIFEDQVSSKSQADVVPMLTPAVSERAAKNVFTIPSFHDDLPALNTVFKTRKDILSVQKISVSKKNNGKKDFNKNYNFLKESMAKNE